MNFESSICTTRQASVPANEIEVDLPQIVFTLSEALDLVGIDDVAHGKRVGVMAAACGRTLGLSEHSTTQLFDLGMLHDIGVSSTRVHDHLVAEFDWDNSQQHCETGYSLLRKFQPLAGLAEPVRYHHTRWEILSKINGFPPETINQANLIFLVDRVDVLAAPHYANGSLVTKIADIRKQIGSYAGSYFSPELVEAFMATSTSEAFWLQLEPRSLQSRVQEMLARHLPCKAGTSDILQLAGIFASIVDAKSPFTANHSHGVARLSLLLAERMGFGCENCDKITIAGLLHDLGKLRVPDEILDKPDALDERERQIINTHSYETFQILNHIKGFDDITQWASYHHEEPDGSGYPFHLCGDQLPVESRIIRVADIFQAMAQNRPYRSGLPAEALASLLKDLAEKGRVDAEVVRAAMEDMPQAMNAANPRN